MQPRLQIFIVIGSLALFFIILELIRRGRLRAEYSLIWLVSTVIVLFVGIFTDSLKFWADLLQVEYPPSLIFMAGLGLVIIIQLVGTITVSRLTRQNRDLTQKLAIQDWQIQQLRESDERLESLVFAVAEMTDEALERELVDNVRTQNDGSGPRWGDVRLDNTVDQKGKTPHNEEAASGGLSRGVTEHGTADDRPRLDFHDDGKESRQARSV